ncbi:hypothetical protein MCOR25_007530 [Pyricularia grisea]|nr:hypothetical protein MCOR25_007530 [Pyricularia grisea]
MSTANCVDKPMFFLAASIANAVVDVVILLVPLRILPLLQIARRQTMSLLLLFATGGGNNHLFCSLSYLPTERAFAYHQTANPTGVICIAAYCCHLTIQLFDSNEYIHGLSNELWWMYAELAG